MSLQSNPAKDKIKTPRQEGESCRGVGQRGWERYRMKSEADAGNAAAGDLVGREGLAVFIGEVDEAMGFGGLFQPVDEGSHLGVDHHLCASEADADDYECHVGDSEMTFGAFPETELNGAALAEVVYAGSDGVPVKCSFFGVAAEHLGDVGAEVEEEIHDGVAGCRFDFLHGRYGC